MTPTEVVEIAGTVVSGHGVASGDAGDPRFPAGTIGAQVGPFADRGVDLQAFHRGTLNVATDTPVRLVAPDHVLQGVKWHPDMPPEDFHLWRARLRSSSGTEVDVLVYRPDPATKPEHHQPDDVIEVLAPWLDDIADDPRVVLLLPADRVA